MASHKRWDGSAYVDATTIKRWDGSSWVDVAAVKRWDGSAWVDTGWAAGGTLAAIVSPATVQTDTVAIEDLAATIISEVATVTASGGTSPYTYAWTQVSGSSAVACDSPSASSTTFSTTIYKGTSRSAVYRCTVTDAAMDTTTVDVAVELSR